jgi:hypothetical protein
MRRLSVQKKWLIGIAIASIFAGIVVAGGLTLAAMTSRTRDAAQLAEDPGLYVAKQDFGYWSSLDEGGKVWLVRLTIQNGSATMRYVVGQVSAPVQGVLQALSASKSVKKDPQLARNLSSSGEALVSAELGIVQAAELFRKVAANDEAVKTIVRGVDEAYAQKAAIAKNGLSAVIMTTLVRLHGQSLEQAGGN